MKKRLKILYRIHCVCLTAEILFVMLCLFALIFGASSPVEWIILLIMDAMGISGSVSIIRELKKQMDQASESQ